MYFIKAASSVSHQPAFRNPGFSKNISSLLKDSTLVRPDYKEFISGDMLRRMSEIIRMSVACTVDCLQQSSVKEPDAIIIGTGLGCLFDTEKFLATIILTKEGLIPPTSFIQSTHNTIAGQISLILKNHNYNMTHTQNTLSFEHALTDALLHIDEGKENILVGGADENIKALEDVAGKLGYTDIHLTSGASCFVVSKNKNETCKAQIVRTAAYGLVDSITDCLNEFIGETTKADQLDLVLYSGFDENLYASLKKYFGNTSLLNYQDYCGTYFSNSSFALHLAVDILTHSNSKRILICNNLNPENLGLTLIESLEA